MPEKKIPLKDVYEEVIVSARRKDR